MTQPFKNQEPGRSQMSYGRGQMAHPLSDYQSQRELPWRVGEDKRDVQNRLRAERRSDPTNGTENVPWDMYFAQGNPDQFGPGLPLCREKQQSPPVAYKQPILRYGVDRQS